MGIGDRGNDLGAMVDAIALELFWSQNEIPVLTGVKN